MVNFYFMSFKYHKLFACFLTCSTQIIKLNLLTYKPVIIFLKTPLKIYLFNFTEMLYNHKKGVRLLIYIEVAITKKNLFSVEGQHY